MRLHLDRFGFGRDSTLGVLHIPGTRDTWTLEEPYRRQKIKGETCIPYGTYPVTLRTEGGFHARYQERFPDMHEGMLWIRDIPDFRFVLIHIGNIAVGEDDDTDGCILPGERYRADENGEFSVGRSEDAYRRIYPVVRDALNDGEEVELKVAPRYETEHG